MAHPQDTIRRIVIVGSGLAGATAAGALRDQGFDGEIVVLGRERHRPYELPALSKKVLLGDADEPDWVHGDDFYAARGIELRLGTSAERIHFGDRVVRDDQGGAHPYDRLLLATGSVPRTLPVPGGDSPNLWLLRTLDNSLALRSALAKAGSVVIVGGGWIGCEVAAAARGHGAEVTVVETMSLPLYDTLGRTIAGVFHDLHAEHGVHWRLGARVTEFGVDGSSVRLADGTELSADVVVVAVGAAPTVDLAHLAGLELSEEDTRGGVAVDAGLRTSSPDVFAIGDIAAHFHPRYGRRIRVEHWANAKNQGSHVAGNLLGAAVPYEASPYFFTDQYDLGMEYRGLAEPDDELVIRGDLAAREFIAFWLRDDRVQAAMNVNMWDDGTALRALVDARTPVDPTRLQRDVLSELVTR
jgi:3-phenylpropionate/trans-cinnamate dioxygenase ferredoxin reductase subunit